MVSKREKGSLKENLVNGMLCILTLGLFAVAEGQMTDAEIDICSNICSKEEFVYIEFNNCLLACQDVINEIVSSEPEQVPSSLPLENVGYLENSLPDGEQDMAKRKSSFVRIGRQKSSFVRIGRSVDGLAQKRPSSFVRIGKSDPEFVDGELNGLDKRASAFVRIGKSNPPVDDVRYLFKRPSSFVRIGKKSDPMEDGLDEEKRQSSFVRIGKSMPEIADDKRASSFVRIGRPSSFVRIGKKNDGNYKRVSSFVRIGKKDEYDSQDPIGSDDPFAAPVFYTTDEDQKRASNFVRIGKSYDDELAPQEKRASSFVRIGKSSPFGSKRMSNFVRIGKRSTEQGASNTAEDMGKDSSAE